MSIVITTNNNNINAGTGSLTCGAITTNNNNINAGSGTLTCASVATNNSTSLRTFSFSQNSIGWYLCCQYPQIAFEQDQRFLTVTTDSGGSWGSSPFGKVVGRSIQSATVSDKFARLNIGVYLLSFVSNVQFSAPSFARIRILLFDQNVNPTEGDINTIHTAFDHGASLTLFSFTTLIIVDSVKDLYVLIFNSGGIPTIYFTGSTISLVRIA